MGKNCVLFLGVWANAWGGRNFEASQKSFCTRSKLPFWPLDFTQQVVGTINVPRTIFQIFVLKPYEFRKFRNTKKYKNPISLVRIFKFILWASSTMYGHVLLRKREKSMEPFFLQVQRRNEK